MKKKLPLALLCLSLALGVAADAEDDETEAPPAKVTTALKLSVVYTRYQAEKKISSLPYMLSLNADGGPSRLRMGLQVPIQISSKDAPGSVVFKDVSNNVDCSASSLPDARFHVRCTIEQTSVYQGVGETGNLSISSTPVLRMFRSDESMILRDGQTTQLTSATDPVSGEVLKVDVTLNVLK